MEGERERGREGERERGREGGREGGRERGREGERERGREGERERGREGERERGREGERERDNIYLKSSNLNSKHWRGSLFLRLSINQSVLATAIIITIYLNTKVNTSIHCYATGYRDNK